MNEQAVELALDAVEAALLSELDGAVITGGEVQEAASYTAAVERRAQAILSGFEVLEGYRPHVTVQVDYGALQSRIKANVQIAPPIKRVWAHLTVEETQ